MSSFTDRSYRVARDGRSVVCDTIAQRDELDAIRDAIAWRRDRQSWMTLDDADSVLALRALTTVDDLLAEATAYESEALVTINREQALTLCEVAGAYVNERDVDSYQAPEERERIACLARARRTADGYVLRSRRRRGRGAREGTADRR